MTAQLHTLPHLSEDELAWLAAEARRIAATGSLAARSPAASILPFKPRDAAAHRCRAHPKRLS